MAEGDIKTTVIPDALGISDSSTGQRVPMKIAEVSLTGKAEDPSVLYSLSHLTNPGSVDHQVEIAYNSAQFKAAKAACNADHTLQGIKAVVQAEVAEKNAILPDGHRTEIVHERDFSCSNGTLVELQPTARDGAPFITRGLEK
jgi:hypothetical protein